MGTNKDQAQAQAFMLQRVISALTVHETDPEQPPFRRPLMAAIAGIVVGGLVLAGFWVYGLLVPGGDQFTATDVIAVEEETGARYVLINGRLHPVVNYTSALLALDKHADVQVVPRDTLDGIPVGPPIGIPDAPDSLPGKDSLLTGGWATCDQSIVDDSGTGQDTPVILVGQSPRRGHTLAGEALLVHSGGHVYVVYAGYRHEIAAGVDVALELGTESPVTVTGTWLDTVPAGRPIAPIPLSDAGTPSGAVPGLPLVNGQLLVVDDGISVRDKQFYLVTGGALLPVSPLQAAVQRVLGPHADPPVTVTNRALVNATRATPTRPTDDDPPWTRPQFATVADPETTVCAHFRPGSAVPDVVVGATLPSSVLAGPAGQVRVAVPPGRAALVEVMSGPAEQRGQGTVALVTDQGRLHPLADPRHVPQILGYDGVAPVRVTAVVADRVPRGKPLSPEAARVPVT